MKKSCRVQNFIIFVFLFSFSLSSYGAFREILNKSITSGEDKGIQGQFSFTDWKDHWVQQPGNKIFQPSLDFDPEEGVMVFHGGFSFTVKSSVEKIRSHLPWSEDLFKIFDPSAKISGFKINADSSLNFVSQLDFTPGLKATFAAGRNMKGADGKPLLGKHNQGHIEIHTVARLLDGKNKEVSPEFLQELSRLGVELSEDRFAIMVQGIKINQLSQFVSSLLIFEKQESGGTRVRLHYVFGLEKDIPEQIERNPKLKNLLTRFVAKDSQDTPIQDIFLGKVRIVPKKVALGSGISQGTPGYSVEITNNLKEYLEQL